jgi:hypothetical protein
MSAVLNIDADEHMLVLASVWGIYCGLVRRRSIASRRSALIRAPILVPGTRVWVRWRAPA